ncbi:MAG: hypothetical protein AAB389_01525 [Patescibacteria group bacterium]
MNLNYLIGMQEADAIAAIKAAGMRPRVTARDGENYMLTADYRTDRINLCIKNGMVVRADIG